MEQVISARSWIAGDYHCKCKLLRRESSGGDKGISRISRDTRTDIHVLCYKGIVGRPLLAHSCTWNLGHQTIITAGGGGRGGRRKMRWGDDHARTTQFRQRCQGPRPTCPLVSTASIPPSIPPNGQIPPSFHVLPPRGRYQIATKWAWVPTSVMARSGRIPSKNRRKSSQIRVESVAGLAAPPSSQAARSPA